jgi:hypothetical protein
MGQDGRLSFQQGQLAVEASDHLLPCRLCEPNTPSLVGRAVSDTIRGNQITILRHRDDEQSRSA